MPILPANQRGNWSGAAWNLQFTPCHGAGSILHLIVVNNGPPDFHCLFLSAQQRGQLQRERNSGSHPPAGDDVSVRRNRILNYLRAFQLFFECRIAAGLPPFQEAQPAKNAGCRADCRKILSFFMMAP